MFRKTIIVQFLLWWSYSFALDSTLTINLDSVNKYKIKPVGGVNTNFFLSPEKYNDEQLWIAVEQAKIPVIRFPGGLGNWYDWRESRINTEDRPVLKFMENIVPKSVPLDSIISLAKIHSCEISYVINIYDTDDSIVDLILHLLKEDAPVKWIEIGSENYHKALSDEIDGPGGYLQRAKVLSVLIRENGYKGKMGIVLAPNGVPGKKDYPNLRRWNEVLSDKETDEFDAVILHYYPSVKNLGFKSAIQEGVHELAQVLDAVEKQFPEKEIWVTEWNIGRPANIPESNTMSHAIFSANMLKQFSESEVKLACYHILAGRGWELVGPDRFTIEYESNSDIRLIRRVPYFVFSLFNNMQIDGYIHSGKFQNVEYFILWDEDIVNILLWSESAICIPINIEYEEYTIQFINGIKIQGDLMANNGSLLQGVNKRKILWKENVIPEKVSVPKFEGPGVTHLNFSIKSKDIN
ncbi:MAG: hypothetical protein SCARUB_04285 [Candidatus Scalindua rubra]|uniref:Uncharacterized protein n=1 Tax=Candidatus Scalindua rubra TaxID=1872076 RepID=A0A1E3X6J4_9BACT|nr:MAG: hypothetical protein SCARUB_04285 [Candidatus Scalindua rubra]